LAEALAIERLTAADLPGMLPLSAEAGWNQTAADWRIFLEQGRVFGIRSDARLAATAAILPYGRFAWISMVLVTAAARKQGLGTLLLRHCIAELQHENRIPYLDATPAGEKVYLPLGFRPVFGITRWQGRGDGQGGFAPPVDLDFLLPLDTHSFGAKREPMLRSFLARQPSLAIHHGTAFVVARDGRLATQIGPLSAPDEAMAFALLKAALDRVDGPVFLDVPDRWTQLGNELQQRGFTIQRGFRRMALDTSVANGNPDQSFVLAGPEFG
jgi:GNAT superfamily N-acetyltransferase